MYSKIQFFGLLAVLFVLALATVWVRTVTVRDTYQYVQNEKSLKNLERAYQSKRVEWLRLTTPERLERLAVNLEMGPPKLSQLIRYTAPNKAAKNNQN